MIVTTPGDETSNRLWRRVDHQGEFMTFEVLEPLQTSDFFVLYNLYNFE